MKKNKKIILISVLSILGAIGGWILGKYLVREQIAKYNDAYTTIVFNEELCQFMFGCEPKDFSFENTKIRFFTNIKKYFFGKNKTADNESLPAVIFSISSRFIPLF